MAPTDEAAVATANARGGSWPSAGAEGRCGVVSLPDAVVDEPVVRSLVEPAVAELVAAELWARTAAETLREDRPQA